MGPSPSLQGRAIVLAAVLLLALPALAGCFGGEEAVGGGENHAFLGDPLVRRALALAVDAELAREAVPEGLLVPAPGLLPRRMLHADEQPAPPPFDPEAAARLLDSGGYRKGSDGYRFEGAVLRLLYREGSAERRLEAEAVATSLDRLGVRVELVGLPWVDYLQRLFQSAGWDLALATWTPTVADPDDPWVSLAASRTLVGHPDVHGDTFNTQYQNPLLDEALLQARATTDPLVRSLLYGKAASRFAEDPNLVVLGQTLRAVYLAGGVEMPPAHAALPGPGRFAEARREGAGDAWTLRYAASEKATSLDPASATDAASRHLVGQVYEGLLSFEGRDATRPAPRLATGYTVSVDGRTYTFTLRENVTFSNGNPFTAEDVLYTFERFARLATPDSGIPAVLAETLGRAAVEEVDAHTVRITLPWPHAGFPAMLATSYAALVDAETCDENGGLPRLDDEGRLVHGGCAPWLRDTAMGTGPYRVTARDAGGNLTLERVATAWNAPAPAAPARVLVQVLAEDAARARALREGRVDVVELAPDAGRALAGAPGVRRITGESFELHLLVFQTKPEVRDILRA